MKVTDPAEKDKLKGIRERSRSPSPAANRDCWHWLKEGKCSHGDQCQFAHPPDKKGKGKGDGSGGRNGSKGRGKGKGKQASAEQQKRMEEEEEEAEWRAAEEARAREKAREAEEARARVMAKYASWLPHERDKIGGNRGRLSAIRPKFRAYLRVVEIASILTLKVVILTLKAPKMAKFGAGLPGNRAEIYVGRLSNGPKPETFRAKNSRQSRATKICCCCS